MQTGSFETGLLVFASIVFHSMDALIGRREWDM